MRKHDSVQELQTIWYQVFGELLSDDEAFLESMRLQDIYGSFVQPSKA